MPVGKIFGYLIVIAFTTVSGCFSLKPVGKYAAESAKVTAVADLGTEWIKTYEVQKTLVRAQYWTPTPDKLATQLEGINTVLTSYFKTMAKVAGLDSSLLNEDLKGTVKVLKDDGVLSKSQQESADLLVKVVSEGILDYRRRQELQNMVIKADPSIQSLVSDLLDTVETDFANAVTQEIKSLEANLNTFESAVGKPPFNLERTHLLS
ncbi:MAG: hypothetical protein GXP30_06620, partial [Verrucomicrobia bacterium]|nr:hypothetical protein [Verrucomicrobiota bacterium]